MLYPEEKERENRFKLALRMGLPIFLLAIVSFSALLYQYFNSIPVTFVFISIIIFAVMIYYIFYLIYRGFEERVTDPVTFAFTREYTKKLFEKEIQKGPYTIILLSIDNLGDINSRFGIKNGDKVLYNVAHLIGRYLKEKGIQKVPIGHYKGGDFFIGLRGNREKYQTIMEMMCIKFENYRLQDIEVSISAVIADTSFSSDLDQLTEHLNELKNEKELIEDEEEINQSDLENRVINAVKNRLFQLMYQRIVENFETKMVEISVKLNSDGNKLIHQKTFMPIISRSGLLREFETMIFESVLRECSKTEENIVFVIPVSPSTLRQQRFFNDVQMLFSNNEAARNKIMFTLKEKEYYHHVSRYNDRIQAYRRMGIYIALDRLGVFHTTMLYLKDLDVDMVCFDTLYGRHIKEKGYQAILSGLNTTAKDLGIKTWIKMIEDEEGARIASKIGIDCMQGNYLGRISLLDEVLKKGSR